MSNNSLDREKQILEYLREHGNASIQELVEVFGVSNMTIHRDLKKLDEAGYIQKRHGGATLVNSSKVENESLCAMCSKTISQRAVFIVKMENEEEKRACCAHCGLMLQNRTQNVWQSLAADYLHGHMVSANQAFYLIGSDLTVCCVPSVLTFGSKSDAQKFQKGFGGQLLTMEEAVSHLHGMMHMQSGM